MLCKFLNNCSVFNKLVERIAYDLNKPRDFVGRATTTKDDWSNFNVVEDKIGAWYVVWKLMGLREQVYNKTWTVSSI